MVKVLFCASEVVPFAKTGGLADVAGALPLALEKLGLEMRIALPKYRSIAIPENTTSIGKNVQVDLIKHDEYFCRDGLYGTAQGDYPDNLDRFVFYCQQIIEAIRTKEFCPDIIHCHDWQTALIPVYLNTVFKDDMQLNGIRTVFTIHNLAYQGVFPEREFSKTTLPEELMRGEESLEFYGKVNLLKGGLVFSDLLTTVSNTYSREIQTKEFGCGLEGVLQQRADDLSGILNGLDCDMWDPSTDMAIAKQYSVGTIADKAVNKADLQKEVGLEVRADVPLIGIISRLADQKGFDILVDAMKHVLKKDVQFVLLGTGDEMYHRLFEKMQKQYPKKAAIYLRFDAKLAQKIYAGCDMFLMPSRFEPCGLGQMIALRYGTIPIVRATGGLADTITEYNKKANTGNGFVFSEYSGSAFLKAIDRACAVYARPKEWRHIMTRGMESDFSWDRSAREYVQLYERLLDM